MSLIEIVTSCSLVWVAPLSSADHDPVGVEDSHLRRAQMRAVSFCLKLGCRGPVSVKVEAPVNMPDGILAHTTKWGDACVLTFTRQTLTDESVVAHEACHCALDYDVAGEYGYLPHVDKREQAVREAASKVCVRKVIGRDGR